MFELKVRLLALVLLLSAGSLPPPVWAQDESTAQQDLTAEEIEGLRERAAENAALDDAQRTLLLDLFDQALGNLRLEKESQTRIEVLKEQEASTVRQAEQLTRWLATQDIQDSRPMPETLDSDAAREILGRRKGQFDAYQTALRDLEELAEADDVRRRELAARRSVLNQEIELVRAQLRGSGGGAASALVQDTRRLTASSRLQRLAREGEALQAEQELLEQHLRLLPLQEDRQRRYLERARQELMEVQALARALGRQEAATALLEVQEACAEFKQSLPSLSSLADETEELAVALWAEDGVILSADRNDDDIVEMRRHVDDLVRMVQTVRRQFEAVGLDDIGSWWPDPPESMPTRMEIEAESARVVPLGPIANRAALDYANRRSQLYDISAQARELAGSGPLQSDLSEEERHVAITDMLARQRSILSQLVSSYQGYADGLTELGSLQSEYLAIGERAVTFLLENQLWARSVDSRLVPRPIHLLQAVRWYLSPSNWRAMLAALVASITLAPSGLLLIVLAFGGVLLRPRLRGRLITLGGRAKEQPRFKDTLEATAITMVLAAPVPLLAYGLSIALDSSPDAVFATAAAAALRFITPLIAALEVGRVALAPNGLGEAQFGWPESVTRTIHPGLKWQHLPALIPLFISFHIAGAGLKLTSPDEYRLYSDSLGRILFVVGMSLLGASLFYLFRPRRKRRPGQPPGWFSQTSLFAYPAIFLATIFPALLATSGRYYTAYVISDKVFMTLWLGIAVILARSLFQRWKAITIASPETLGLASEEDSEHQERLTTSASAIQAEQLRVDRQLASLLRFVVLAATVTGAGFIWSDVAPALQMLKRFEVWPTVTWHPPDSSRLESFLADTEVAAAGDRQAETQVATPVEMLTSPGATQPGGSEDTEGPQAAITLWVLCKAALAGLITIVLVRDLPALPDLLLLRRTRLQPGTRIAVIVLVRYGTAILGSAIAFSILGIAWDKIQWLAAALTFGLGFGLQEVVANFVSGLILLVERPIRVGDSVTVDKVSGVVSRIRIRSTTVTLYDLSEMIVPNKEFVTKKLVNWTLSDQRTRVQIDVRVPFGTDVNDVKSILTSVAAAHPAVMADPAPSAILSETTSGLQFALNSYIDFSSGPLKTKDELQVAIEKSFREAGIELGVPPQLVAANGSSE